MGAVPEARAAVHALLALEGDRSLRALGDGLPGAHRDAGWFSPQVLHIPAIAEDDVVTEASHRLHLAAHQQRVLLRDQKPSVRLNLRPTARRQQRVMQWAFAVSRSLRQPLGLRCINARNLARLEAANLLLRRMESARPARASRGVSPARAMPIMPRTRSMMEPVARVLWPLRASRSNELAWRRAT